MALVSNTAVANDSSGSNNQNSGAIDWGSLIGSGIGTAASIYGTNQSTNALVGSQQNAINTQSGIQGQLQNIYGTQRGLGVASDATLAGQLGLYGQPNYAAFMNSPGFQGSLSLGNQAIERAASANGSLYTPNMLNQLGQYDTTYASQNYNNYIGQLLQSAGLGAQGNAGLAQGIYGTGANISQLQTNQGSANASGIAGNTTAVGNLLGKLPYGQIGSAIGNAFGSGSSGNGTSIGNYSTYDPATGAGNFSNNSLFGQYANNSGYDPVSGNYSGGYGGNGFNQFSSGSGYDPTTGTYSSPDNTGFTDPNSGQNWSF